ncbi:hypothetical protein MRX96_026330 [Rhipicephalus microplus]
MICTPASERTVTGGNVRALTRCGPAIDSTQRHLRESDLSRARSLPRLYERRACFRAAGTGWDTAGEGAREKDLTLATTGPSSLPASNRCVSASPNNGEIRPLRVRVGRAAVVTHPARACTLASSSAAGLILPACLFASVSHVVLCLLTDARICSRRPAVVLQVVDSLTCLSLPPYFCSLPATIFAGLSTTARSSWT